MMIKRSDWQAMKTHAFACFKSDGRLQVHELEQVVAIGCRDGDFDDLEKSILVNIISKLTRADLDDAMWAKVDELIQKFELESDKEATMERLPDDIQDE